MGIAVLECLDLLQQKEPPSADISVLLVHFPTPGHLKNMCGYKITIACSMCDANWTQIDFLFDKSRVFGATNKLAELHAETQPTLVCHAIETNVLGGDTCYVPVPIFTTSL